MVVMRGMLKNVRNAHSEEIQNPREGQRLQKHMKNAAAAEKLQENRVMTEEKVATFARMEILMRAQVPLYVGSLISLLQLRCATMAKACVTGRRGQDVGELLSVLRPYADDSGQLGAFDVNDPRLAPLLPLLQAKRCIEILQRWFISELLSKVAVLDKAEGRSFILTCATLIVNLEQSQPDDVENLTPQAIIEFINSLTSTCNGLMVVLDPCIHLSTAFYNYDDAQALVRGLVQAKKGGCMLLVSTSLQKIYEEEVAEWQKFGDQWRKDTHYC